VKVLRERELQIEAGERIAIIGPNGIGKTTLMRCLAGKLKPDEGHGHLGGERELGYMPQDPQAEFAEKVDLFTG
jgi:ATPase subunit of ABC transporter with duplicated ATPase domains